MSNIFDVILKESLTEEQAMDLLLKFYNQDLVIKYKELVLDAFSKFMGLPLAIAIIGHLDLKDNKEWEQASTIIQSKECIKIASYSFNLYTALQASIDTLDGKKRSLFLKLAIFNMTQIYIKSIISLWNLDESKVKGLLTDLNSRSLLKYDNNR